MAPENEASSAQCQVFAFGQISQSSSRKGGGLYANWSPRSNSLEAGSVGDYVCSWVGGEDTFPHLIKGDFVGKIGASTANCGAWG